MYLKRFSALVRQLQQQSHIRLLSYHAFAPVREAQFREWERRLGHGIPSAMRRFYGETNGLQLRWIADTNEAWNTTPAAAQPLAWDYALRTLRPEEGCIFLLPLEMILFPKHTLVAPSALWEESIDIQNKTYSLPDFYERIRLFDAFSSVCSMAMLWDGSDNPLVLMGDDGGRIFSDSRLTDFDSYLNFLLAQKGLATARPQFYRRDNGYQEPRLETADPYWTSANSTQLETWLFAQRFPLSDKPGSPSTVRTQDMQAAAMKQPLSEAQWAEIVAEHQLFLRTGGSGGRWKVLALRGISVGMYLGAEGQQQGKQAILDMRRLPNEWDLQEIQLPYSSWCGAYTRLQDFSGSNLEGSLWADALAEKTIFADCNLQNADFSRANLRQASFMNANLRGVDFENADLSDADFRGAYLEGARFAGAKLKGVLY